MHYRLTNRFPTGYRLTEFLSDDKPTGAELEFSTAQAAFDFVTYHVGDCPVFVNIQRISPEQPQQTTTTN